MSAGEGFFIGVAISSALWVLFVRRWDASVDRDIEARRMALSRERTRRIFDRHAKTNVGDARVVGLRDEAAAVRDPEWREP